MSCCDWNAEKDSIEADWYRNLPLKIDEVSFRNGTKVVCLPNTSHYFLECEHGGHIRGAPTICVRATLGAKLSTIYEQ